MHAGKRKEFKYLKQVSCFNKENSVLFNKRHYSNSTIKSILQSGVKPERQPEIVSNGKYSLCRDLRWAKTWIHILVKHKESYFEDVDLEKSMKNPSRVYQISSDLQAVDSDEQPERRLNWFMILAKAHLHL